MLETPTRDIYTFRQNIDKHHIGCACWPAAIMYTTSHAVAAGPMNGTDSSAGVDGSGTINPAALSANTGTSLAGSLLGVNSHCIVSIILLT